MKPIRFPLLSDRTALVLLNRGTTPKEIAANARRAASYGVDGSDLNFEHLKPEFRNPEKIAAIVDASRLPLMALWYRKDEWSEEVADDGTRAEMLLAAAGAGVDFIDVMGDLFDPSPDERTENPQAVAKQEKLIEEIHARGSRVIISTHPKRPMTTSEVVNHLKSLAKRGGDVVKVVATASTEAEFAEAVQTTLALRHELEIPFVHLCNGPFALAQRQIGLMLGCAFSFVSEKGNNTKPLSRNMCLVRDNLQWHIDRFE